MNVTKENGLISTTEMTATGAEILMTAVLNGAEARKECAEPSTILRRIAMHLDQALLNETTTH